jgi:hypothetical protein
VTPADLGKPIAAIVQRCGAPSSVMSVGSQNEMLYAGDDGQGVSISFDADQVRARILQFFTYPPEPSQPFPEWSVTLPFASGTRAVAFEQLTLSDAESDFAADADVTTPIGTAYRSTPADDIVLAFAAEEHRLRAAFIGERPALVQSGIIASPLDAPPLAYIQPVPRETWLRDGGAGPRTTILRIDVDAEGIARKVTAVVASGDAAFDAALQTRVADVKFRPATLANRPVSGAVFVQMRH